MTTSIFAFSFNSISTVIKFLLIVICSGLTFCWLGLLVLAYYHCIEIPVVFSLVTFTRDEIGLFCCWQLGFFELTSFILWNFWKSSPSPGAPPKRNIKICKRLRLNIARIAKLPYMAKKGFIERKGLFKERLYLKKGFFF